MTLRLAFGAGLAAMILLASPLAAQSASAPDFELTRDVREAAALARQAIALNNFQAASGHLGEVSGEARTDGDRYLLATLALDIANRTFDQAGQLSAIDRLLASPLISESQRAQLRFHRARILYHRQDSDGARAELRRAIETGAADPRTHIALAALESDRQEWARALELYDRAAALTEQRAQPVPATWYRRALDLAQRSGNMARAAELSRQLIAAYPNERNWRDVISYYRRTVQPDPQGALDSWRLQAATGALSGEDDYRDYLRLASAAGQPGEIVRVVQAGRSANMLDGRNDEIVTFNRRAEQSVGAAREALASRAAEAAEAATGEAALAVAEEYMGFGDPAQAAMLYRTALEKGGIDTGLAQLRLGMALALAGETDAAQALLAQVEGDRSWLAQLWRIYAQSRPPAPPAVSPAEPTG